MKGGVCNEQKWAYGEDLGMRPKENDYLLAVTKIKQNGGGASKTDWACVAKVKGHPTQIKQIQPKFLKQA